ncbi:MAG: hypothetical protein MK077_07860 [Phycisphaerales bacterium]|nr:hypothetical protein [Phycisphaerales bacterium]
MSLPRQNTLVLALLIGLATLPDALVPIALKSAVVDRWGVSLSTAVLFAGVALLGAVLVLPLIQFLDRSRSPGWTIAWASIVNAIVLAIMAAPVSLGTAMVLRLIAGGMDMITLAVLLGLLERGDPTRSGHRFGPASLALMLGLSLGFALGGAVAKAMGGQIFLLSAAFSVLLAVAAGGSRGLLSTVTALPMMARNRVRYWPALAFHFADRGVSAILAVPLTLFLIEEAGVGERIVGLAMSMVLLCIALGAWPAGVLADRLGPLPVRILGVTGYAMGFAALAGAPAFPEWGILAILVFLGVFGAGLAPSMYVLAARRNGGAIDMGGVNAAGAAGYLVGTLVSGAVMYWRETTTDASGIQLLLLGGATVYLLINMPAIAALAGWRVRSGLSGI